MQDAPLSQKQPLLRLGIRGKLAAGYILVAIAITFMHLVGESVVGARDRRIAAMDESLLDETHMVSTQASFAFEQGFAYALSNDVAARKATLQRLDKAVAIAEQLERDAERTDEQKLPVHEVVLALLDLKARATAVFKELETSGTVSPETLARYDAATDTTSAALVQLEWLARSTRYMSAKARHELAERILLGIGAVSIVLGAAIGRAIGRRIASPILSLRDRTLAFATGQELGVTEISDDEVGELAATFGHMAHEIATHIEAIREGQRKIQDVFASMDEVLVVCDGEQRIESANPKCCRMAGYQLEHLVGQKLGAVVRVASSTSFPRASLSPAGRVAEFSAALVAADGREIPIAWQISALTGSQGWVLAGQDLTDRNRLEAELRQAQKLEAVGRLAAGVAHEINTPMQFIGDNLQFVGEACTELVAIIQRFQGAAAGDPASQAKLLAEAAAAAEESDFEFFSTRLPQAVSRSLEGVVRVSSIVRSMKEFAHPDRKGAVAADLNRLVESTLVVARNEYKYVADLVTDFGRLPPVTCFPGEFNQAILNIVVNAAHAIGDAVKGTPRRGTIRVVTRLDGDSAVVSIADDGGGIPDDIRGKIFEPFFTTKEVGRGTGQGLAIVRGVVVDRHKGRIDVDTAVGQGTTFTLTIPIAGLDEHDEAA